MCGYTKELKSAMQNPRVAGNPLVVKALEQKPDGIVFVCNAEKIAKIIKELRARGWTKMMVLHANSVTEKFLHFHLGTTGSRSK